ncbi:carboxylate-amine ligase [Microbacterium awajiense]|uniref:Putative glutamate--cysteine ligase 2 n=1 Tax=Microbacterium awajiense TaxID=415214 RepID=A0ABP7AMK9_9MICO
MDRPAFSLGIEEEYLLVDVDSRALAEAPEGFIDSCRTDLADQVSPEFLQCQVEIGTKVCANIGEAREELRRLRSTIASHAARHGLAPIAVSCHPLADWKDQSHTDKDRYHALNRDLGGVARRLLICGCHVHVGIDDDALRIDLMRQMSYFLPHLLAMSCSSPFWQGEDTGLQSYRISVFDNLPRTGLPPDFVSWAEYQRTVGVIEDLGLIEDTSKIWWDIRPSHQYPTLETRIMDVSPRLEDALTLAALTQSLLRMLWGLRTRNQRWRSYGRFLIAENRWRAQRYGVEQGLIDFGVEEIVDFPRLADELVRLVEEDAVALECLDEVQRVREIAANGTSSTRQRAVADAAREAGHDRDQQMRAVVDHLIEEFHRDL